MNEQRLKLVKKILQRSLGYWDICPKILGGHFCETPFMTKSFYVEPNSQKLTFASLVSWKQSPCDLGCRVRIFRFFDFYWKCFVRDLDWEIFLRKFQKYFLNVRFSNDGIQIEEANNFDWSKQFLTNFDTYTMLPLNYFHGKCLLILVCCNSKKIYLVQYWNAFRYWFEQMF